MDSKSFYEVLLEIQGNILIGLDGQQRKIVLFSRAAANFFSLKQEDILGKSLDTLKTYIDIKPLTQALDPLSGSNLTPVRTQSKGTGLLALQWELHPVGKKTDAVLLIAKPCPIDKRVRHLANTLNPEEIDLLSQQDKPLHYLLHFANDLPGSIYFKDVAGCYLWANDWTVQAAGKQSVLELVGNKDHDLFPKQVADIYRKNDKWVMQNKQELVTEEPIILQTGEQLTLLSHKSPIFDQAGKVLGVIGNSTNISAHKKESQALQMQNEEAQQMFYYLTTFANSLPGSLYFKNLEYKYVWANDFMVKIAKKRSLAELIGKTDYDITGRAVAEEWKANDQYVIQYKRPLVKEESALLNNGEKLVLLTNKTPVIDKQGQVIGVMGNSVDISAQKAIEDTLRDGKATAEEAVLAKADFIANMSHDIRTPMAGIIGMGQDLLHTSAQIEQELAQGQARMNIEKLSQDMYGLAKRVQEDVKIMIESSEQLLDLLNSILEAARLDSQQNTEKAESMELRKLVQSVFTTLLPTAKNKGLTLRKNLDSRLPKTVIGIAHYIYRILLNLTSNALKFTETGYVEIELKAEQSDRTYQAGQSFTLLLSVTDTGAGIPKDKFDVIFGHFSRLNTQEQGIYQGAGLGLHAVKTYVEEMSGTISLSSEVGKGSCFLVKIPLEVDHDKPDQAPDTSSVSEALPHIVLNREENKAPFPILVVEDSTLAALGIQGQLKALNCPQVDHAKTGTEALDKIQKNNYRLILMDSELPDFTGMVVTQKIRALKDVEKAQTPIIALTGHGNDPDMQKKFLEAGMQDVICKPAKTGNLKNILKDYLPCIDNQATEQKKIMASDIKTCREIVWKESVALCGGNKKVAYNVIEEAAARLQEAVNNLLKYYANKDEEALRNELHSIVAHTVHAALPKLEVAIKKFQDILHKNPADYKKWQPGYSGVQEAISQFQKAWRKHKGRLAASLVSIKTMGSAGIA